MTKIKQRTEKSLELHVQTLSHEHQKPCEYKILKKNKLMEYIEYYFDLGTFMDHIYDADFDRTQTNFRRNRNKPNKIK